MVIYVKGMTCKHCVENVENAINAINGIKSVTTSLKEGKIIIFGHDLEKTVISEAITSLGFTVLPNIKE